MLTSVEIETKVKEAFPDAQVKAMDLTGTGDHWQVKIASSQFEGKTMIQQHQLVYKILGTWVHKEIHALTLETQTL